MACIDGASMGAIGAECSSLTTSNVGTMTFTRTVMKTHTTMIGTANRRMKCGIRGRRVRSVFMRAAPPRDASRPASSSSVFMRAAPPQSFALHRRRRGSCGSCGFHQAEGLGIKATGALLVTDNAVDGNSAADLIAVALCHGVGADGGQGCAYRVRPRQRCRI